jgi:RNA polymerase sigma-70 factor, ECF subfamily
MIMGDVELPDGLRDELRAAWHRYVDLVAPARPALHGYCRRLTGNVWDAEDLVQDTLVRTFATLGKIHHQIREPRAYLLRTASNLWVDTIRRRGAEAAALAAADPPTDPPAPPGAVREAGSTLMQRLAPQERAAVVLKDVFDLTLEEIASILGTTVGAVKSALHRGRTHLRQPEGEAASRRPVPSAELVDRFVARYNAGDVAGLTALMLEGGAVENVGCSVEFDSQAFGSERSWFYKAVHGHPEWPAEFHYEAARLERGVVGGEPVALGFATRRGREALEQVLRFEERDGRIVRLRGYAFCPETMREIGAALGFRVRTGLYRYPTPEPGTNWDDVVR